MDLMEADAVAHRISERSNKIGSSVCENLESLEVGTFKCRLDQLTFDNLAASAHNEILYQSYVKQANSDEGLARYVELLTGVAGRLDPVSG